MNSPIDEQVAALQAMIRQAGGITQIDEDAPEEIKRAFLQMIMNCPDCQEQMRRGKANGQTH